MRTEILKLLSTGKKLNNELASSYSEVLSQHIIDSAKHIITDDLPNKVNAFLSILNTVENEEKYSHLDSIDDAISLFENEEIQKYIDIAADNKDLSGLSPLTGKTSNLSEVLNNALKGMESSIQLISVQIQLGESLKTRGDYS